MPTHTSSQDNELAEFFTDVEQLRDTFESSVAAPTLTRRLLIIHGVGGVGKSSLLRMFRLHCKSVGVPVALVSGDEAKSAFDVLARWAADLNEDGVSFPAFSKTFKHYRELQARVDAQARKAAGDRAADIASKAASKTAEATGGALMGAAIGSVVPGLGTTVGAALGGVLGGMGVEALIDWLRGFLKQSDVDLLLDPTRKLTDDFLDDIALAADMRRVLLMLDTFEQMTALDDWARDVAQRLNANVLFVIAGRAMPKWSREWPSWMGNALVEELKPMSDEVMRALVRRYYATLRGGEPDPCQVEAIISFARGLPIVVTSAVQLWVKFGVEDFESVKPEIVANLVDRLMEGVPNELIPALEAAAIVRWFDQPILRAVMKKDDVRDVYNELRRFPFVRTRAEGLALHNAVREIMDENLRSQDSERHDKLHEYAATHFEKQLEKATGEEAERLGLERLYHRISADEEAGARLFQEMAEELTRYRLVNRLRTLLNDANTYSLERRNSRLWREYYSARLAHIQRHFVDAEKLYKAIGYNTQAESKLKAYALCDLGEILGRFDRIAQAGGVERAVQVLELARTVAPLDSKLVHVFSSLRSVYEMQGLYDKAIDALHQELEFFQKREDQFGVVDTLASIKGSFALMGNWKEAFDTSARATRLMEEMPENSFLKLRMVSEAAWLSPWAGRYHEAEGLLSEALVYVQRVGDIWRTAHLQFNLGYILGLQGKFQEATSLFEMSAATNEDIGREGGDLKGFWGQVLSRYGMLDMAEEILLQGLASKRRNSEHIGIPEILNWLGELHEIRHSVTQANKYYQASLDLRSLHRHYFECGALTGLVRVRHEQNDYAALPPLLTEAEKLAQEYEYNDHLVSLRLTQGHVAWEGKAPSRDNGFEAVLYFYQHTLIYALRYNRFLLDEVLSGRPQGTPLRPIIPSCLERGEEGRKILVALLDWWKTGVNDIGTSRPDTISPIPEGISLLEGEHIARQREPGNGLPHRSAVEQIEAAL